MDEGATEFVDDEDDNNDDEEEDDVGGKDDEAEDVASDMAVGGSGLNLSSSALACAKGREGLRNVSSTIAASHTHLLVALDRSEPVVTL